MAVDPVAIQEAYDANADFEETSSVAKCRAFISACVRMLNLPAEERKSGSGHAMQHRFEPERVEKLLAYARQWLANNVEVDPTTGNHSSVIDVDFTEFDNRC